MMIILLIKVIAFDFLLGCYFLDGVIGNLFIVI